MIVPALLTDKRQNLVEMIKICEKFAQLLQIDVMDGLFVPSSSIGPQDLAGISSSVDCEAHLMVNDPLVWLKAFKNFGAKRVLFHQEIKQDHNEIISAIKAEGMQAGIVLNPQTSIDTLEPLIKQLEVVLFMSVNPGFYGAPFIPEVLPKIKEFKRRFPKVIAGIDGGVKPDNIRKIKNSGVDYICVGSAILKAQDPAEAFKKMEEVIA